MDYSNIDEVAKAIMDYDRNLGMTFYNLPAEIGNAFSEDSVYYTKKQFKKKYGKTMRELGYNIH